MMKQIYLNQLIIFLCLLPLSIFVVDLSAQNNEVDDIAAHDHPPVLHKVSSFADEAVGVMDKGQLQNLTMNYGMITDTRYEDVGNAPTQYFFDFRYPRKDFTGLIDDFSIFVAIPKNSMNNNNGNVIEGWTDNDNEDWVAKDGSYGLTHYNPSTDPNPHEPLKYPPDNPTTPYLAHSDLPITWPVDETGAPFWPGYFRRDPVTDEFIEGEFASDRDVYAVFTDDNNQQGDVVGLEVEMMAYCYGRPYADKFQFYEFYIHNTSGTPIDNCYVGYYQDPDCSDYGEEILILPDPKFDNPDIPDIILQRDIDGATRPNSKGVTEYYSFGMAVLETPKDIGVTTFHYYDDAGPTEDDILWPIISNDPTDSDIKDFSDRYFHGADKNFDDVSLISEGFDAVFIVATGPFTLEPGEVVKSTIVVAVDESDDDFYDQIDQAVQMYNFNFVGPAAPPAPAISVVPSDGKVTLYWDDQAERAVDVFTGDSDFEGYRIYRSQDNGQTWGKEIIDAKGNLIGYFPLAQFDIDNDISGADSRNPFVYLGDNTGIRHMYEDKTVKNGISYAYTVVAYDRGDSIIYSLESARGTSNADKNFVTVTPRPNFSGKVDADVESLLHTAGNGKGEINISIIDENILTTDTYEIRFKGDPANRFDIYNAGSASSLLSDLPLNTIDNAVIDGFMVTVDSERKLGGLKSISDGFGFNVMGSSNPDSSKSWYVEVTDRFQAALENRVHDYEIRFVNNGSLAYGWGLPASSQTVFQAPFEVWDITDHDQEVKICFQIQDVNSNQVFDEGEAINIVSQPYADPEIGELLPAAYPADFPYRVNINNYAQDTENTPPQTGDVIRIESFRSLRSDDVYTLQFRQFSFDPDQVNLKEIRVVPNPYLVGAAWELLQNSHQVRFMFLPPVCTIDIYSIGGEKVNTIKHDNYTGEELFNLVNSSNQALAFGVYVYVIETPDKDKHIGKFAIIR
ncbi:MAG: hypothetical protein JW956_11280 [Calditrichaceae bacterium]|nr:hypothetical protein [Calditrichaceae bacterium]